MRCPSDVIKIHVSLIDFHLFGVGCTFGNKLRRFVFFLIRFSPAHMSRRSNRSAPKRVGTFLCRMSFTRYVRFVSVRLNGNGSSPSEIVSHNNNKKN